MPSEPLSAREINRLVAQIVLRHAELSAADETFTIPASVFAEQGMTEAEVYKAHCMLEEAGCLNFEFRYPFSLQLSPLVGSSGIEIDPTTGHLVVDGLVREDLEGVRIDPKRRRLRNFVEALANEDTAEVAVEKSRGRPAVAKYASGNISWGKKTCDIPEKSLLAFLCAMTLADNTKIGQEWSWDDVHERLYGSPSDDKNLWRKVENRVRALNMRAKKKGIPQLLEFKGGSAGIIRRIR